MDKKEVIERGRTIMDMKEEVRGKESGRRDDEKEGKEGKEDAEEYDQKENGG